MKNAVLVVGLAVCGQLTAGTCVMESARKIPLAKEVDVLVVGGSSGAVAGVVIANRSVPRRLACRRVFSRASTALAGVARKIFEAYAADGRGVFALHARTVLGRQQ